jgi:hypothetical protein
LIAKVYVFLQISVGNPKLKEGKISSERRGSDCYASEAVLPPLCTQILCIIIIIDLIIIHSLYIHHGFSYIHHWKIGTYQLHIYICQWCFSTMSSLGVVVGCKGRERRGLIRRTYNSKLTSKRQDLDLMHCLLVIDSLRVRISILIR